MPWKLRQMVLISMLFLAAMATAQSANSRNSDADDDHPARMAVNRPAVTPEPKQADPMALSPSFAWAGVQAAITMRTMQSKLRFAIEHGYPLHERWIMHDREQAEDALQLAALSASTEADRAALQQLAKQHDNLQQWSDWAFEAYRTLRLGEYYVSPSALGDDELFQKITACSQFLIPMLASGQLAEDTSCR